jgi:hypothetical protein
LLAAAVVGQTLPLKVLVVVVVLEDLELICRVQHQAGVRQPKQH